MENNIATHLSEASFTFATCTALAVRYSGGDLELPRRTAPIGREGLFT
jgi:hypothetical protein